MPENPNSAVANPINASSFALDVQGITAMFTEADGFENSSEVITHVMQGPKGNRVYQKVPGNFSWADVTLKRGFTADEALWNWRQQVLDGKIDEARKNGTITGYNTMGEPVVQYTFQRGWISKWAGSAFNAGSNDMAIETITITHEGLDRTK